MRSQTADREGYAMGSWREASPFWTGPSDRDSVPGGRAGVEGAGLLRPQPEAADACQARGDSGRAARSSRARAGTPTSRSAAPRRTTRTAIHLAFVHHTAGSNSYTRAQSAAIVRGIELYHVKGNGWNDIGYNFLVDKYGQMFEGRYGGMTRPVVGAHSMGFNSGSFGVAVIGDYGSTSITPAARAALVSLLAWRLDLAHVDPLSTRGVGLGGEPALPGRQAGDR